VYVSTFLSKSRAVSRTAPPVISPLVQIQHSWCKCCHAYVIRIARNPAARAGK